MLNNFFLSYVKEDQSKTAQTSAHIPIPILPTTPPSCLPSCLCVKPDLSSDWSLCSAAFPVYLCVKSGLGSEVPGLEIPVT